MKQCRRMAFTLVELAIGILLILIISVPVVMTLRSGLDLYTKTEANAQVVNGVRFTLDSFSRRITPMVNETIDIKVLNDPVIPDPVPKYENYVYLSGNSLIHRDSSGDHILEGSEHIEAITFTLPSSAVESPDNFMLDMSINGSYKTAKLDVAAKETLYNTPVKDGDNIISGDYVGNVIWFKTPGVNEMSISFDLYDKESMIKINNSRMPKGTVILASYDLNITRNGIEVGYTDGSSLDWYISGSTGTQREISTVSPNSTTKNQYQYLLVDSSNNAITGDTMLTSDDFYIRTNSGAELWIEGGYGVIRSRLTPYATTYKGKILSEPPVWSPYVEIKNKTFWETWLGAISGAEFVEGFFNTDGIGDDKKVILAVNTEAEQLAMGITRGHKIKATSGAFTVARLDYKYFDNDRLYSIWKERPSSSITDTIPAFMTITNYSVLVNMKMNDIAIFGITLSDTPNISGGVATEDTPFNDMGYTAYMCALDMNYTPPNQLPAINGFHKGVFVHPQDGSSTANYGVSGTDFSLKGITNMYYVPNTNVYNGDCYNPAQIQNSEFVYTNPDLWWPANHRILYSVLEYYNSTDSNKMPKYIIRVRFLKPLSAFTASELAELEKEDPWFMGPSFFASEPMWFGDFVGNIIAADNKTVDVRRYHTTPDTTVVSPVAITNVASDRFYGLKNSTNSTIFKKRLMDLDSDADDTNNRLSVADRDRYIGMQVYIKNPDNPGETVDVYEITLVPGFTGDEIRSVMPKYGKLYNVAETIPDSREPSAEDSWYVAGSPIRDYNNILFGTNEYSDGVGNTSRYNNNGIGIIGLQHVPTICSCPLDNEIFKWIK